MYISSSYKKHHLFIYKHIHGVIATDFDYHIPLKNHPKYIGLIPNPINIDKIDFSKPIINDKIIIFHGVNRDNYYKKGNYIFDEALKIIETQYGDSVIIKRTENIPYKQYIESYNSCHILLDQIYAYDQGYNALEAMAKGKVVFTGAETEFLNHYSLKEDEVCINALPNVNSIVKKLEVLIFNPSSILAISKNARDFITKHHHYKIVAQKYLDTWSK